MKLSCSFCCKSQREVKKLIAGPSVYICDECIGLCNDIIAEEVDKETKGPDGTGVGLSDNPMLPVEVHGLISDLDQKLLPLGLRSRIVKT